MDDLKVALTTGKKIHLTPFDVDEMENTRTLCNQEVVGMALETQDANCQQCLKIRESGKTPKAIKRLQIATTTKEQLDDLENRIRQFIEVNDQYDQKEVTEVQNRAFESVLMLIEQLRNTGKIKRGNAAFPDEIETMVKSNKWERQ